MRIAVTLAALLAIAGCDSERTAEWHAPADSPQEKAIRARLEAQRRVTPQMAADYYSAVMDVDGNATRSTIRETPPGALTPSPTPSAPPETKASASTGTGDAFGRRMVEERQKENRGRMIEATRAALAADARRRAATADRTGETTIRRDGR